MTVNPLYLDFFEFLDQWEEGDPWEAYQRLYLQPHELFLMAYWENFRFFDLCQIAGRVRQIKKGDYGPLRSLIQMEDPRVSVQKALERCQEVFPLSVAPDAYLFVGFFSADGVAVEVDGHPSIAIGLERFQDFKDLSLIVSHEYCHCAQRYLLRGPFPHERQNLLSTVVAEGLSVLFSQLMYPHIPLHRHLFIPPERLQWGREHKETLLELAAADLATEKLIPILFGAGDPDAALPPRLGYFIAREMLSHCLTHHGAEEFGKTIPGFEDLFRKILASGILSSGAEE
jgi:hypothetical protein